MERVCKAVIPAAGRGLRMRSISGGTPKEMLIVGGKPMILRALEMHLACGITQIAVLVSPEKMWMKEYLSGLIRDADSFSSFSRDGRRAAELLFIEQEEPLGVAHAVSLSREFVGNHPFALVMPDSLLAAPVSFLAQLLKVYSQYPVDTIGFFRLERSRAHEFGNVGLLEVEPVAPPLYRVLHLSDKNSGTVRFEGENHAKGFAGGIYGPGYFDLIPRANPAGGELDDVPIHQELIHRGALYGVELEGIPFDLGNPAGYLSAARYFQSVAQGLENEGAANGQ